MTESERRLKKRFVIPLCIVAALILAGGIVFLVFYNIATMDYSATIEANIDAEIKVMRDKNGLPLIEAETKNDVFFALGYIHGQDRLAVMEYYRMLATGLAERLLGEDGKILDHVVNVAGIRSATLRIIEKLPDVYKGHLESYANGVNSIRPKWRKFISSTIPNRQWDSRDIVAVLLLKEWTNAFLNNKELLFPMPVETPRQGLHEIIPPQMRSFYREELSSNIALLQKIKYILKTQIGFFCEGFAFSIPADANLITEEFNAFSFNTPYSRSPDWYPVSIKYADMEIQAITCAGLPFILAGKTNDMSFYSISLDIDTQDFIMEEIKTINGITRFLSREKWEEFSSVDEPLFNAAGKPEDCKTVWYTENRPVLNEISNNTSYRRGVLTMRYILPQEDYIVSLFELPHASGVPQIINTVRGTSSLPKVYFICEKNRNVAIYSGKYPLKTFSSDTLLASRAARPVVFKDLNTTIYSTKYAFVGSELTDALGAAISGTSPAEKSRYERLDELIRAVYLDDTKTTASIREILTDITVPWAEKFVPVFIKNLSANPTTSARFTSLYLKKWDSRAEYNSVASTLFHSILLNYIAATFADKTGFNINDIIENHSILIEPFYKMVMSNSLYFDDKTTEDRETKTEIFDRAFLKTLRECSRAMGPVMNEWRWEKIHKNHYHIPFKKNFMAKFAPNILESVAQAGGITTIYNNGIDADLRPESSSSLLGFFSSSHSEIAMNFSYAMYPLSKFYINGKKEQNFIPFRLIEDKDTDTLYIKNRTSN